VFYPILGCVQKIITELEIKLPVSTEALSQSKLVRNK